MKKIAIITFLYISIVSCVSQNKYDGLYYNYKLIETQYQETKDELNTLRNKYQQLIKNYNALVDEYNDLNYKNRDNEKNEDIIERAKDAVYKLKMDFQWFMDGSYYSANDIERDIRSIEDKLDGWL